MATMMDNYPIPHTVVVNVHPHHQAAFYERVVAWGNDRMLSQPRVYVKEDLFAWFAVDGANELYYCWEGYLNDDFSTHERFCLKEPLERLASTSFSKQMLSWASVIPSISTATVEISPLQQLARNYDQMLLTGETFYAEARKEFLSMGVGEREVDAVVQAWMASVLL